MDAPETCADCGRRTTVDSWTHRLECAATAAGEARFVCTVCPDQPHYTTYARVQRHILTKHSGSSDASTPPPPPPPQPPQHPWHRPPRPKCHQCEQCGLAFVERGKLQQHQYAHTGERPFRCQLCPMAYTRPVSLRLHQRIHAGERTHLCPECGRGFYDSGTLEVHRRQHSGETPYECHLCGKRSKQASNLKSHYMHAHKVTESSQAIRTRARPYMQQLKAQRLAAKEASGEVNRRQHSGEGPYECHLCGKRSKQASNLKSHYSYVHKVTESSQAICTRARPYMQQLKAQRLAAKEESGDKAPTTSSADRVVSAGITKPQRGRPEMNADLIAPTAEQQHHTAFVGEHLIKLEVVQTDAGIDDTPDVVSTDDVDYLSVELKVEAVHPHSNAPFAAGGDDDNDNAAADYGVNDDHYDHHDNEDAYAENVQLYADPHESITFIKIEQPELAQLPLTAVDRRTFECYRCHLPFGDERSLRRHTEAAHRDRPPESRQPDKPATRQPTADDRRRQPKAKAKRVAGVCELCGLVVADRHSMRRHMITHQPERTIACADCPQLFKTMACLRQHRRVHSDEKPYVCGVCGKRFRHGPGLNQHARTHTGVKPYACEYCDSRFADASMRRQHELIHTGELPYRCHLCGKGCTQVGNLKSHLRHFHKIEVQGVRLKDLDKLVEPEKV